jgi:CheY-like chemotaxis protein
MPIPVAKATTPEQPASPPPAPPPPPKPVPPPTPRFAEAMTGDVLVAEDNDVNRIVFSQILDAAGISYRIVGNGAEAVEAWQQARPSIIVMDISMPVMNGLQAAQEIRRLEAETGEHVPIVGVTAHALDGDREMCLASGMDDYITKPISPERLEDRIRHWTGIESADQVAASAQ